jgi:hypothetical protein
MYYTRRMAMGKRKRDRQPTMWVTTTDLPTAASHPFYRRLNQLLRKHAFDDFVEAQCAGFYAETMGRPGLPPVPRAASPPKGTVYAAFRPPGNVATAGYQEGSNPVGDVTLTGSLPFSRLLRAA